MEDSPNSLFWCVVIYTKKGFLEWLDGQLGGQLGGHYHGDNYNQIVHVGWTVGWTFHRLFVGFDRGLHAENDH